VNPISECIVLAIAARAISLHGAFCHRLGFNNGKWRHHTLPTKNYTVIMVPISAWIRRT